MSSSPLFLRFGFTAFFMLALPLTIVVLTLGSLAWVRYLRHKETLRMIEAGGESKTAVLEARERRQARKGWLVGAILLVLGLALLVPLGVALATFLAMSSGANHLSGMDPGQTVGSVWLIFLGAVCAFVIIMGAIMLAAYAKRARGGDGDAGTEVRGPHGDRWRTRAGILRGVRVMLLGLLVLFLAPATAPLVPWRGEGSIEIEHFVGAFGAFIFALGLVSVVAYGIWSRRATDTPVGDNAKEETVATEQPE